MIGAEDRFAADDLTMRCVWAADASDLEATVATFTLGSPLVDADGGEHRGEAVIRAYAKKFLAQPGGRGRIHFFQQMRVGREGDGLRVFSFWHVVQATGAPRETRVRSVGTCDDLCIKVDGVRRFAERRNGRWNDAAAPWNFPAPTE